MHEPQPINIAYRKVTRRLYKLLYRTHNIIVNALEMKLHRKSAKFIYTMINNDSELMYDIMNYFMFNNNSIMSENFRYLSTKYRISIYEWRSKRKFSQQGDMKN